MEYRTPEKSKRRRKKTVKKFTYQMQKSLMVVFGVVLLVMVGLIFAIVYMTRQDGERYEKKALSQKSYVSSVMPYRRGSIMDRNGIVLARSDKVYNIILDPKVLLTTESNVEVTLTALCEIFALDYGQLKQILEEKPESSYVILKKHEGYEKMAEFEARVEEQKKLSRTERITGVWFEEEYVRTYPYGTLASHLLGYTNAGNVGTWGVEQSYNSTLNGTNGRIYGYYDAELNLKRTVKAPQNGNSLITTINVYVQEKVEAIVNEFLDTVGAENIGVIVMDPNSGEILAMVSNRGFDLNDSYNLSAYYTEDEIAAMEDAELLIARNQMWRNFCISDMYEPGSTFKPFTVAAALEENLVKPTDTFLCNGVRMVGGWPIHCNKKSGHGHVTLAEALMKSCNPALMEIGEKEGGDLFHAYLEHFGFGKKTGIDLPGEAVGILHSVEELGITDLLTNSFGQNFSVTMIQMAAAYCSLVNGGYYYQPHVVKEIVNDNGATVEQIDPVLAKETVSASTSEFLKDALYLTVESGTATPAKVEGYLVGGKTGTAQKIPRDEKKYVVSFIGAVPADDPQLVIYVAIDELHDEEKKASSTVATTMTSQILSEILPFTGIYPEGEIDYKVDLPQTDPLEGGQDDPESGQNPEDNEPYPDAIPDDMGNGDSKPPQQPSEP